jgi:hypothetical protein
MDFDLADETKKLVKTNEISKAIELAENELSKIPLTDFHKVLGRDFLNLKDELVEFISSFHRQASKKIEVKAIYSEMNGFTINYDLWFLNAFAFKNCEGIEDTDWLADYEFTIDEIMGLRGLEDIQAVYEDYMKNEKWNDKNLENAMEVCEIIIVLRFQELFKSSVEIAIQKKLEWCKIPIFATAHDYEILYSANL